MIGSVTDTAPDVMSRYRAMLLARSPSERIVMACGMFEAARALVLSRISPTATAIDRRVHLFVRTYSGDFDADTAARVIARIRRS